MIGRRGPEAGGLSGMEVWWISRRVLSIASRVWSTSLGTSAAVRPVVGIGGRTDCQAHVRLIEVLLTFDLDCTGLETRLAVE
jgi:hypothetical protein